MQKLGALALYNNAICTLSLVTLHSTTLPDHLLQICNISAFKWQRAVKLCKNSVYNELIHHRAFLLTPILTVDGQGQWFMQHHSHCSLSIVHSATCLLVHSLMSSNHHILGLPLSVFHWFCHQAY